MLRSNTVMIALSPVVRLRSIYTGQAVKSVPSASPWSLISLPIRLQFPLELIKVYIVVWAESLKLSFCPVALSQFGHIFFFYLFMHFFSQKDFGN